MSCASGVEQQRRRAAQKSQYTLTDTNQAIFSMICGALDVALAWRLPARLSFPLAAVTFGAHRRVDQLTRILISLSVLLIAFGVWYERFYGLNA